VISCCSIVSSGRASAAAAAQKHQCYDSSGWLAGWPGINSLQFLLPDGEDHSIMAHDAHLKSLRITTTVTKQAFSTPSCYCYFNNSRNSGQLPDSNVYSLVQDLGAEEELGMVGLEHFSLFPVPKSLVVPCQLSKTDMTYLISSRPEAEVVLFRTLV